MSKYALCLPDSLYEAVRRLARHGRSADLDAYRRVLAWIPDSAPVAGDELPEEDAATRDEP